MAEIFKQLPSVSKVSVSKGMTLEGIARQAYGEDWRAGLGALLSTNKFRLNRYGSPILQIGREIDLPNLEGQDAAALSEAAGNFIATNSKTTIRVRASDVAIARARAQAAEGARLYKLLDGSRYSGLRGEALDWALGQYPVEEARIARAASVRARADANRFEQAQDASHAAWLEQQNQHDPVVQVYRTLSTVVFSGESNALVELGAMGEYDFALATSLNAWKPDVYPDPTDFNYTKEYTVFDLGLTALSLIPGAGIASAEIGVGGSSVKVLNKVGELAAESAAFGAPRLGLRIPQGMGPRTFDVVSGKVRAAVGDLGLGDDIFVMGSRSGGTARAGSDFDFGIRVSSDRFDDLIAQSFGNAKPGSALSRTRDIAIRDGRIQTGEAGLRGVRGTIARTLGVPQSKVQISVIRGGGVFDNGPQTPLAFGF